MPVLEERLPSDGQQVYAVIWTTTPWTLPANKAIAVNANMQYSLCKLSGHDGLHIIGSNRISHVESFLPEGSTFEVIHSMSGEDIAKCSPRCINIFNDTLSPIVSADFVSDSSGTGLVHCAPGHGMEDYQMCLDKGISPAFAPVDDAGRYTADVAPNLVTQSLPGLRIEDGTHAVLSLLQSPAGQLRNERLSLHDLVLASHSFVHKNPIDWRTKKPVIVRSTAQWFADVSKINPRALASLEDVDFIPPTGKNRLRAFIESRGQWCISRQRAWGVPIPVIYHKETDKENHSQEIIEHIISTIEQRGTDAWFTDAPDDPAWFPASVDPSEWIRKRDTMDVWFDSGTSWTSIPQRQGQQYSDVYLEGSDQHRGWFQSSLLTKIATQDEAPIAPYKKLITHGFTLDGNGKKMSKSIGNVISPMEIISGQLSKANKKHRQDPLGPDLLRLWVASCDYTKDVTVSAQSVHILQQALQKYRVTMRFLLGVLHDVKPEPLQHLRIYDQIILNQLSKSSKVVFDAYKAYSFYEGVREVNNFINADLSAFYFEIIKDIMYTDVQANRIRTQAVLLVILNELLHWLAPLTPHLVEEIWENLPESLRDQHPHRRIWTQPYSSQPQHEAALAFFEPLSRAVKTVQERARAGGRIGSGLACRVEIHLDPLVSMHGFDEEQLRHALVVSELRIASKDDQRAASSAETVRDRDWAYEESFEIGSTSGMVRVLPPTHEKCPRCWQYTAEAVDILCQRCEAAVAEQK